MEKNEKTAKIPVARGLSFEPQIAKAFGLAVRESRLEAGVAQDALALSAGVDRSYYGKLERGERQPSLGIIVRIARALEMTPGRLVDKALERISQLP